jgi:general secretion pathway protein N
MMRRAMLWLLAGLGSVTLTVLAFVPALWMVPLLETQTGGRLTLGDAQGTLWRGSAFIGASALIGDSPGGGDPVTPLLPGRFAWRLSPAVLLGWVDAELENPAVLSQPVRITGNWHEWQVSPSSVVMPAERLAALGAPLNTLQPSGRMRLSWQPLQLARHDGGVGMNGSVNLELNDMASRLSPLKPLGNYNLTFDWRGQQASVKLETVKGSMLLNGTGVFANGHLQFSGTAEAAAGQEERLANLLSLLGPRRRVGGRDVIALEFK